jgi:hypothetical protein
MSKAAHTPTPWQLSTIPFEVMSTDSAGAIYGPPEISGGACFIADVSRSPGDQQAVANAELIVTAVNHHQELVTRLYNLVNQWDSLSCYLESYASTEDVPTADIEFVAKEARETLKKITM